MDSYSCVLLFLIGLFRVLKCGPFMNMYNTSIYLIPIYCYFLNLAIYLVTKYMVLDIVTSHNSLTQIQNKQNSPKNSDSTIQKCKTHHFIFVISSKSQTHSNSLSQSHKSDHRCKNWIKIKLNSLSIETSYQIQRKYQNHRNMHVDNEWLTSIGLGACEEGDNWVDWSKEWKTRELRNKDILIILPINFFWGGYDKWDGIIFLLKYYCIYHFY